MRRLRMFAMLPALLAAASCASIAPAARAPEQETLSVVSFNVYHDKADWPERLPLIVDGLRALEPDVIALQEVLQHERLPNQAQAIADALGYRMHFVSVDPPGQPRRYGNAILTPHPVLMRSQRRLQPFDDGRTVAHVRIDIGGRAIDVYATHLHHTAGGAAIRRRQLQDVLAHVEATTSAGAPRILLGDFNATIADAALQPLLADYIDSYGSTHVDADAQPSNTTLNPAFFDAGRRIDHILAERGRFEVLGADIVLDRAGVGGIWPSDHFGMHATLRLRRTAAPATPRPHAP